MNDWFGEPERLWLILVPLALFALFLWDRRRRRALLDELVSARLFDGMVVGRSRARRRWRLILVLIAVLFIVIALMRPQWGNRNVELTRKGIDIVFAIDVSRSMLARDVKPNRVERVKLDVRYFVHEVVEEDRIALVAFAGTARTLCPLTLDLGAFEVFLDELDIGSISRGGTNMASALAAALDTFGDDEKNHKAIILFTDGEGHDPLPDDELKLALKRGVRIYTIGIGSDEGVRIPLEGEDGGTTWLKDHKGNIVLTRLDDKRLKTIAQRSLDGAYTHLSGGRGNLERIYADNIRKIEERELKSRRQYRRVDRFQIFLVIAGLFLGLAYFMPEGRRLPARFTGDQA
ncbi:MAG: VWA domain-containing protein [Planctomycetota bacterium]